MLLGRFDPSLVEQKNDALKWFPNLSRICPKLFFFFFWFKQTFDDQPRLEKNVFVIFYS